MLLLNLLGPLCGDPMVDFPQSRHSSPGGPDRMLGAGGRGHRAGKESFLRTGKVMEVGLGGGDCVCQMEADSMLLLVWR